MCGMLVVTLNFNERKLCFLHLYDNLTKETNLLDCRKTTSFVKTIGHEVMTNVSKNIPKLKKQIFQVPYDVKQTNH